MDLGGAAAGGVPCGTLSFFRLPAAGGVPCGLSLSLGFLLLAVFRVDPFSLWPSCWLFSWRTTSVDLGGAAAGGVPCGTLPLFGLPAAGCVPCGPLSLSLGFLLLAVFRVGPLLSLGFLLDVLFEDNFCGSALCCCWLLCAIVKHTQ